MVQWDPVKARANLRDHGIRFADAVTALEDERAISVRDDRAAEERWVTIGMDSLAQVLVVGLKEHCNLRRAVQGLPPVYIGTQSGRLMKKEYDFKNGRRGTVLRVLPGKTRVTIRLDDDVLEWFRARVDNAGGGNYQSLINEALRTFMQQKQESLEATLRRVIRDELRRTG